MTWTHKMLQHIFSSENSRYPARFNTFTMHVRPPNFILIVLYEKLMADTAKRQEGRGCYHFPRAFILHIKRLLSQVAAKLRPQETPTKEREARPIYNELGVTKPFMQGANKIISNKIVPIKLNKKIDFD